MAYGALSRIGSWRNTFQAVSNKEIKVKESNDNLQNTPFLSPPSSENVGPKACFYPLISALGVSFLVQI